MLSKSKCMSDHEFIEFCYQRILKRELDEEGKIHYIDALTSGHLTRDDLMIEFLTCDEYLFQDSSHEFVPPGHFYSAIPSIKEKENFISANTPEINEIPGVNLNSRKQFELLERFVNYYNQCPFEDNKTDQFRYYFLNPAYSYGDALTLYSMLREFKPKKVVEIGSGYSSCVTLDTNDIFFNGNIDMTFIEPYPELLHSLLRGTDNRRNIIPKRIQDVDLGIFNDLKSNDILLVDSTHVSKLNSDVNKIIFEILPSLQKGVLVHFHDIFWPFEYSQEWIQEGRAWNETYILRAFLEFNENFEILFFADYLRKFQHKWFMENMPLYLKNSGGNIWLRKI